MARHVFRFAVERFYWLCGLAPPRMFGGQAWPNNAPLQLHGGYRRPVLDSAWLDPTETDWDASKPPLTADASPTRAAFYGRVVEGEASARARAEEVAALRGQLAEVSAQLASLAARL